MARPAGIITMPGPGSTSIQMPTSTTVPPTIAMAQRRAHFHVLPKNPDISLAHILSSRYVKLTKAAFDRFREGSMRTEKSIDQLRHRCGLFVMQHVPCIRHDNR